MKRAVIELVVEPPTEICLKLAVRSCSSKSLDNTHFLKSPES